MISPVIIRDGYITCSSVSFGPWLRDRMNFGVTYGDPRITCIEDLLPHGAAKKGDCHAGGTAIGTESATIKESVSVMPDVAGMNE